MDLPWQVLEWSSDAADPVVALVAGTSFFVIAFYGLAPRLFAERMEARGSHPATAQATGVLLSRSSRGVFLGVACLFTAAGLGSSPQDIGVAPVSIMETLLLVGGGFLVLLPLLRTLHEASLPVNRQYMLLILLLMLSQDSGFITCAQTRMLPRVEWYRERILTQVGTLAAPSRRTRARPLPRWPRPTEGSTADATPPSFTSRSPPACLPPSSPCRPSIRSRSGLCS